MRNQKRLLQYLNNTKIKTTNEPKFAWFVTNKQKNLASILVEVGQEVLVGDVLAKFEDGDLVLSTINGKVVKVEEVENKDASFGFSICIENNFKKLAPLKKLINPQKDELLARMIEANLQSLTKLNVEKPICINTKDDKHSLRLNETVLNTFLPPILKGANLIKKAHSLPVIYLLANKKNKENIALQLNKLNLKGIEVIEKCKKDMELLDLQLPLDFYEAVSFGNFSNSRIIAVAGESIKETGYFVVKKGTPLSELIELCGNLKHTYGEIEQFKEDAQMAIFDEIQIKEDIKKEKDASKKLELKALLKNKKTEAQETIFKFFNENKQKYGKCLANMVFLEENKRFDAKSPYNMVGEHTQAVLFLSNNEHKRKRMKK